MSDFDRHAPVIIGVGEASRKTVSGEWPSPCDLAGAAIRAALADSGHADTRLPLESTRLQPFARLKTAG